MKALDHYILKILFIPFCLSLTLKANPYTSGILAEMFPGLGYYYNEDYDSALLSSTLIIPLLAPQFWTTTHFAAKSLKSNLSTTSRNLFGYSVYDSFHQALEKEDFQDQVVPLPYYDLKTSYLAVFNPESYKTWHPYPLILLGASSFISSVVKNGFNMPLSRAWALPLILAQSMFIGMGEEAEFRGFQYPAFAQLTGSDLAGSILSSMSFGACHTQFGIPLGKNHHWRFCGSPYVTSQVAGFFNTIDQKKEYRAPSAPSDGTDISDMAYFANTFLTGLYFSWVTRNGSLLESIAAHSLYDFILIASDLLTTNNTGRIYLSLKFDFQ
jgi:membrane protease YdiL (CAAX protease family)